MECSSRSSIGTALDMLALCADAAAVVGLRTARIAAGGRPGAAEARLMVTEKIAAAVELQLGLITGKFGKDPRGIHAELIRHVHREVRANRKRLGRR